MKMKGLALGIIFAIVAILAALVFAPIQADAFELGGLEFSVGPSNTATSDVQIVGRSDGRSFVGGGICSKYAYRLNVADVFGVDALSVCGIASGSFDGTDDAKFIGGFGISPISLFDGKLKTFVGVDVGTWKIMQGQAMTLSAIVQF